MALGFKCGQSLLSWSAWARRAEGRRLRDGALAPSSPPLGTSGARRKVNALDAAAIGATYGSGHKPPPSIIPPPPPVADQGEPAGGYRRGPRPDGEPGDRHVLPASWGPARKRAADPAAGGPPSRWGWRRTAATAPSPAATARWSRIADGEVALARDVSDGRVPVDAHGLEPLSFKAVLHEAFTDGAHLLLIGSTVVGFVSGRAARWGCSRSPPTSSSRACLLFLLEMGLLRSRQSARVRDVGPRSSSGLAHDAPRQRRTGPQLARQPAGCLGRRPHHAAVLAASASYIVVPAVVRCYAIPEARPSRYFTMALAVTSRSTSSGSRQASAGGGVGSDRPVGGLRARAADRSHLVDERIGPRAVPPGPPAPHQVQVGEEGET